MPKESMFRVLKIWAKPGFIFVYFRAFHIAMRNIDGIKFDFKWKNRGSNTGQTTPLSYGLLQGLKFPHNISPPSHIIISVSLLDRVR